MADYTIIGAGSIKSTDANVNIDVNVNGKNAKLKSYDSNVTVTNEGVCIESSGSGTTFKVIGSTKLTVASDKVTVANDLEVNGSTKLQGVEVGNLTIKSGSSISGIKDLTITGEMKANTVTATGTITGSKVFGAVWN